MSASAPLGNTTMITMAEANSDAQRSIIAIALPDPGRSPARKI